MYSNWYTHYYVSEQRRKDLTTEAQTLRQLPRIKWVTARSWKHFLDRASSTLQLVRLSRRTAARRPVRASTTS